MKRVIAFAVLLIFTDCSLAQRANVPLPATRPTTRPATSQPATQPGFDITIECEVPDLQEWADSLRPIVEKWYPIIVATFPSEGYTAPRKFSIIIKEDKQIAYASGTRIVCGAAWFRQRPNDRGAVVHELVHIAQQYRGRNRPGWLVEGIA